MLYPPQVVFDRTGKGTDMVIDTPLSPETHYSLTIRALKDGRKVVAELNTTFTVYATQPLSGCANVNVLPAAECQALVALYQQTGGPGWANGTDWLSNNTPCEWSGVTCTDGHVTDLNLYYQDLKGSLPAALADLTELRVLALHDNQLTGPIPPELGRLAHLINLDLSRNQLSGGLPAELGQLDTLELFFLNANQLSGELPADWGNTCCAAPSGSEQQRLHRRHSGRVGPAAAAADTPAGAQPAQWEYPGRDRPTRAAD